MNAAQIHLLVVHAPVIGSISALILLIFAQVRGNDTVLRIACWFLLGCLALSGVAYFSGPPAETLLKAMREEVNSRDVLHHGLVARGAFIGMFVIGIGAFNVLVRFAQGEPPARWLRWALLAATVAVCYVFAWAAHLGGVVSHPELLDPPLIIFPELK